MEKVSSTQNQPSPGVSKETTTDKYCTCREDIAEVSITDIQPCPIIPDFKEPTTATLPIIARTPDASICIDGGCLIEQAKAAGRTTVRCHIYHIAEHSDIELAIRKTAIRVMPQGGKCSYAELVSNAHRLRQVLESTSDDLTLFAHGGDRRSVAFADSKEKSIVAVLASRLDKSPTTISKYLQHGKGLNDAAMEELVNTGAPKLFFEAFQVQKRLQTATLQSEQKDEKVIEATISNQIPAWLNEFQRASISGAPPTEDRQRTRADRSSDSEVIAVNEDEIITPVQGALPDNLGMADVPPAIEPSPEESIDTATELKSIGEILIAIASSQPLNNSRNAQALKDLINRLCLILPRILNAEFQEDGGKEGRI
jgi:hypothetical protein